MENAGGFRPDAYTRTRRRRQIRAGRIAAGGDRRRPLPIVAPHSDAGGCSRQAGPTSPTARAVNRRGPLPAVAPAEERSEPLDARRRSGRLTQLWVASSCGVEGIATMIERRFAVVRCADVIGYSRLMRMDEEGTLASGSKRIYSRLC